MPDVELALEDLGGAGVGVGGGQDEFARADLGEAGGDGGGGLVDRARDGERVVRPGDRDHHGADREGVGGEVRQHIECDVAGPGVVAADVQDRARAEDARTGDGERAVDDQRAAGVGLELDLGAVEDLRAGRADAERAGVLHPQRALVDEGRAREAGVVAGEHESAGELLGQVAARR